jgi:putative transposase
MERRSIIKEDGVHSLRWQCQLLNVNRSTLYFTPAQESPLNLKIMNLIDKQHTLEPVRYRQRKLVEYVKSKLNISISRNRVQRLMRKMGLEGEYQKKKTSICNKNHKKYPYLLKNLSIERPNQVWCTDITYIPMRQGYMYMVAIMDWYSRYIISWDLSNTLEIDFCLDTLKHSLRKCQPEIFNSDQGSQFTSKQFIDILESHNIQISMDGRGRSLDNIMIERFWRTLKYENIYKQSYENIIELQDGIRDYIHFYNNIRIHQSHNYLTPKKIYTLSLTYN